MLTLVVRFPGLKSPGGLPVRDILKPNFGMDPPRHIEIQHCLDARPSAALKVFNCYGGFVGIVKNKNVLR